MGFVKFYSVGIILSLVFFAIGFLTLSDYGLNIDEPAHFTRGQAYLQLLLEGQKKYKDSDLSGKRVSAYKIQTYNASYYLKNDSGHPSLNGILAASTNRIFYEKLGLLGDLESYHIFEIFVSSLLVFLVFAIVRNRYGIFAGTIAALSMALYPLFYGESHFNIKDPIEASFFAFTVYFFYLGIEKVKAKYFIISSIFCALAFGTKFNIVFSPFIIIPYFFITHGVPFIQERNKLEKLKRIPKGVYISLFFYPIIVFGIHFISRPFLWQDPINRFLNIVQYYKDIGTGIDYQSEFIKYGINTYPAFFIGISTPIVILTLFTIGTFIALLKIRREKDRLSLLLLLWFSVTLLRVSLPGTSIYSGVRQIMEYIPAMAAIAGMGAFYLRGIMSKFVNLKIASLLILISFIPLIVTLVKLHPNENLYINPLIGGLKGAVDKKIPGAGESMGNVYLQGVVWLNEHAEKNAKYGLPVGLASNIPRQFGRPDLKLGGYFSGMSRDGEYMLEIISVDFPPPRYNFQYLDRFLNPVYVKKVNGVSVLKIWKNDKEHTKEGFIEEVDEKVVDFIVDKEQNFISISLEKPVFITRLEINHGNDNCIEEGSGAISYSPDGKEEFLTPDDLYRSQGGYAHSLQTKTRFVYFFAALEAEKIFVAPYDQNLCLLQIESVKVSRLKDILP